MEKLAMFFSDQCARSEYPGGLVVLGVELVSKELNHFGVIADLFRQIVGYSSRFVLFCSF